jgi:glycine/D-amino acid oxidase-like deaminating enzyme
MEAGGTRFEVAVVGIGLIGAGALRHLATAGVRCIGIGPDEPPVFATHGGAFASHYDSGRITRMLDSRYEWGLLAKRAIANYAEIEAASGLSFHRQTGLVYTAKDPGEFADLQNTADRLSIPCRVGRATGDFPDSRLALGGLDVFVEPAPAGHIDPRTMRRAQLIVAEAHGAVVDRRVAVAATPIDPATGGVGGWWIRLADGSTYDAERVLVAAGPHADEFLAPWGQLAYDVRNEAVITAALDAEEAERLAGLPSVITDVDDPSTDSVYVVPPTSYPDGTTRIKLGAQLFTWRSLNTAEERRTWMRGDEHLQQFPHLKRLLEGLVPGLRSTQWETKPCLIPHTPSELPYVDHLDVGLVVAAGCNGWAGKSADAIGALAAGLLTNAAWVDSELDAAQFTATFASR